MGFKKIVGRHYIIHQVPVVQKVDSPIQGINIYPVDSAIIGFPNIYPVDSTIQLFINWGQDFKSSEDKVYEPSIDNYT